MTPINRKPRIWFYNGYWRCNARPWDVIGVGINPTHALGRWMVLAGLCQDTINKA